MLLEFTGLISVANVQLVKSHFTIFMKYKIENREMNTNLEKPSSV